MEIGDQRPQPLPPGLGVGVDERQVPDVRGDLGGGDAQVVHFLAAVLRQPGDDDVRHHARMLDHRPPNQPVSGIGNAIDDKGDFVVRVILVEQPLERLLELDIDPFAGSVDHDLAVALALREIRSHRRSGNPAAILSLEGVVDARFRVALLPSGQRTGPRNDAKVIELAGAKRRCSQVWSRTTKDWRIASPARNA